ncbi:Uncharacterised protein [Bordetella pertussis]|nr:Uncharacterised protein [Bordetella pertussis]
MPSPSMVSCAIMARLLQVSTRLTDRPCCANHASYRCDSAEFCGWLMTGKGARSCGVSARAASSASAGLAIQTLVTEPSCTQSYS